ncbi:recombinase family protein [Zongyangia hominis]|nr:recombinase family protein [Zongyangia hominis]
MQRVAAYCRVSTDKDDQAGSLENQQRYFKEYIASQPDWQLAELYVDEGITGTSTQKRRAFLRMLEDAQNHRFDLLLTKEISRFARNTLDSIYYTRRLKEWGVGVVFVRDNINTLDPDAELRLTILASIAQEESRKTSDRVKWGQKRRMEQGVVFGRSLLGYDVEHGVISVNERGARIVRLIFHKFVEEGKGCCVIARELTEAGIPTFSGGREWSGTAVLRALRNEKYCGDLIQKKTWTPDYLTHQKKRNQGQEPLVVLKDHHPPIVSREMWEEAQRLLALRRPEPSSPSRYSSRSCFSGKLFCARCGGALVARSKRKKDGSLSRAWRCREAVRHGRARRDESGGVTGCDSRQIPEAELCRVMAQIISSLPLCREEIVGRLMARIEPVLAHKPEAAPAHSRQRRQIEEKRLRLIDLYLAGEMEDADYRQLLARYDRELASLQRDRTARSEEPRPLEETRKEIADHLSRILRGEVGTEAFGRELLDRMVIEGREQMDVFLHDLDCRFHVTTV